ncbi:MAG TPA: hypothetical protein VHS58_23900 [Acetobacteraceae bacterium]|jgi:hypothetical protein|nr:hypothetical protein [Acetobacteraceae bacterium]
MRAVRTFIERIQHLTFVQIALLAIFAVALPPAALILTLLGFDIWDWLAAALAV